MEDMKDEQIQKLNQQIIQKDEMIATMKTKTKDFVQKLKSDHTIELQKLKDDHKIELSSQHQQLLQEHQVLQQQLNEYKIEIECNQNAINVRALSYSIIILYTIHTYYLLSYRIYEIQIRKHLILLKAYTTQSIV